MADVAGQNRLVVEALEGEDVSQSWRRTDAYRDPVAGQTASSGYDTAATTGMSYTNVGAYGRSRRHAATGAGETALDYVPPANTTRGVPDTYIS